MSQTEKSILAGAATTQSSEEPITDLNKIKQVMIAYKIMKKDFTGAALKKLRKRCVVQPTDEEIETLRNDADEQFDGIKEVKREERIAIANKAQNEIPGYLMEAVDEDGMPIGVYNIDYIKYSDYLNKQFHVYNINKNLFVYSDKTRTYIPHVNHIETHCRDTLKNFSMASKLTDIEHETLTHIKSMGCTEKYPFVGKFGSIHVKNGSLDIATGKLTEPTAETMYDYRIETEYKEMKIQCDSVSIIGENFDIIKTPSETPELDKFLDQYGVTEPINVMAKVIWQRAYQDTLKELTVFVGPRDCGKTTLAELVQVTCDGDLHSRNNVSRILLHELLGRFGYADLEGKILNYGDDLPDMFIKNAGRLNELLGSVVRHIEKKGIDGYDAVVTAYYLFSANNLPPLDDDDSVLWGKIHLVEFNKVITNFTPRLTLFTETLKEQLLYRAVQMALSYQKKPYKNNQTADYVREKWHESTTDVDSFIREQTEYDEGFTGISLDSIKTHYEAWCVRNNRKRHMKYLNKQLQPYFRKRMTGNVYVLKLVPFCFPTVTPNIQNICQQPIKTQ